MIDSSTFLNDEWLWFIVIGGVLLWFVFLWKEFTQSGKRRFILKAIVSLLTVCSLAAMVLRPLQTKEKVQGVGVLLTQNYKQTQLDSLIHAHDGLVTINYARNGFKGHQLDSINEAYILGDGVSTYDFWQLEHIKTTYLKSDTIKGIVRWKYDQEIHLGDALVFHGLYSKPSIGNRLVLEDNGGNGVDSITIGSSKDLRFRLDAVTKVAGQFLYKLIEKDSAQSLISEHPIPIVVEPRDTLRVLILNTFPTFETKYLKNFLAQNGHQILVRSQLTKGKYKFESFNRPQSTIYELTTSKLANFDLVILDAASYAGLSNSSRWVVNKQIENEGMGVFIQPDASLVANEKPFGFRLKRNELKQTQLSPWGKVPIPVFNASFSSDILLQPILESQGIIWSAYTQRGAGRMSTSMFQDTYQLVLDGNDAVYQHIWSEILSAVSQRKISLVRLLPGSDKAYINEPFSFQISTVIPNPSLSSDLGNRIGLQQNIDIRDQWKGTTHPKKIGWNHFQIKDGETALPFYVFDTNDWRQSKSYRAKQENIRAFKGSSIATTSMEETVLVPRWWFFILFALSIGFLWLVPRLDTE